MKGNDMTTYAPWQISARRMVASACLAEYEKVNKGKKRHVPYHIPEWCAPMLAAVECDDEVETKRLMLVVRAGCFTMV